MAAIDFFNFQSKFDLDRLHTKGSAVCSSDWNQKLSSRLRFDSGIRKTPDTRLYPEPPVKARTEKIGDCRFWQPSETRALRLCWSSGECGSAKDWGSHVLIPSQTSRKRCRRPPLEPTH